MQSPAPGAWMSSCGYDAPVGCCEGLFTLDNGAMLGVAKQGLWPTVWTKEACGL